MNVEEVWLLNQNGIQEVLGSHDPLAFLTKFPDPQSSYFVHVTGSESDYEPIRLAPGVPDDVLIRQLAANHEYFHFLQNIGTTYGASLRWAWGSQSDTIGKIFATAHLDYRSRGEKITFPISTWPVSGDVRLQKLRTILDTAYQLITVHLARHTKAWANQPLRQFGIPAFRHSTLPASPKVSLGGDEFYLTGEAMLESHARLLETMVLSKFVDRETEQRLLSQLAWPSHYYITWLIFGDRVSREHIGDFLAVIDFALNGRAMPLPTAEAEWQESHPGYRFLNALQVLDRVKPLDLSPTTFAADYNRFLDELSTVLGYPAITKDLGEEAEFYEQDKERFRQEKLYWRKAIYPPEEAQLPEPEKDVLSDHDFMRLQALNARKRFPWIISFPIRDNDTMDWARNNLYPIYIVYDDYLHCSQIATRHFTEQYLTSKPIDLHMIAWALQLLGGRTSRCKKGELECGVSFFDVPKLCPYHQVCDGVFNPTHGWPIPIVREQDMISGCPFGIYLSGHYHVDLAEIEFA